MTIEESTNVIVLSVVSYLDLNDDEFTENLHKDIANALQAERDDMKERAAKVVESHLDVNSDAVWDLIKEIKDLK